MKQIVSMSEILSITGSSASLFNKLFGSFLTASDSPVSEDCPTYKSFASIILKSAGIMLPADKSTISPTVTSLIGIFTSSPSLKTVEVVCTNSFNF